MKDFHEEIPVTTGWLQKSGVNTLRLFLHQVKHRVYLPLGGIYLTMVSHTLLRNYLLLLLIVRYCHLVGF